MPSRVSLCRRRVSYAPLDHALFCVAALRRRIRGIRGQPVPRVDPCARSTCRLGRPRLFVRREPGKRLSNGCLGLRRPRTGRSWRRPEWHDADTCRFAGRK
ncbi:hypothetical protein [Lysobacter gummosus]|uniref:hypothetical protein n=1 Tax=Lysobacter gummosus TaxID=262324 RepID=UPI0036266215